MSEQPPVNLGNKVLIALSNRSASLRLVQMVAHRLADPVHTRVTLFHYLEPIYWEHGGINRPEDAEELRQQEHEWLASEHDQEVITSRYFQQARSILYRAGVPGGNIRTKMTWDTNNVAEAALAELKAGDYTTVVIGRHHHSLVDRLLGGDLADILEHREKQEVAVWCVATAPPALAASREDD